MLGPVIPIPLLDRIYIQLQFTLGNTGGREVIIRFDDIGGIVDHHCLTSLFNTVTLIINFHKLITLNG